MRLRPLIVLLLLAPLAIAQQGAKQQHFSAEDDAVRNPVAVPEGIQRLLLAEPRSDGLQAKPFDPSNFSAARVHLHGAREEDYLIEEVGELRGANIIQFRVFVPAEDGYRLVLKAAAHDLTLVSRRHRGYKDVTTYAMTCCELTTIHFVFDGRRYIASSTSTRKIR